MMQTRPQFHLIDQNDNKTAELVADWYLSEWKIPRDKTIQKISSFKGGGHQFQILMTLDGIPIGSGGLYDHVGLLDKEPRFKIYRHWLALVYTIPEKRKQGFGALICNYIEERARERGVGEMHLFTDTAERLYGRLGWSEVERLTVGERKIIVMSKQLQNK